MSRDNVKRVLVTEGNQAVAAAGSDLGALALGQIGVFDSATGLAIDATKKPRKFFIAVGVDNDGDGVKDNIKESAGQEIQAEFIRAYSYRAHTPGRPQKLVLRNVIPSNDVDEYAFKFEFRNMLVYKIQGTNQLTQTYAVKNEDYTQEQLIDAIVAAVNANDLKFVSAEKLIVTTRAFTVAGDGTSQEYAEGDVVTNAGDLAIVKGDGSFEAQAEFTTTPLAVNKAVNLNLRYHDLRQTVIIGSLVEGFAVDAVLEQSQSVVFEEGDGAQVRDKEFNETGVARPYVLSDSTGTARELQYNAKGGVKYDQIDLEYDGFSVAGFLEHLNPLQTTIAIPGADTVTRNGLMAILDAQVAAKGLDALADDAAASNVDPAVVEQTDDRADATDGIA